MKYLKRIFENTSNGLSFDDFIEKSIQGKLKIDSNGHVCTNWHDEDEIENYLKMVKDEYDRSIEFKNKRLKEKPELSNYYETTDKMNKEVNEPGSMITSLSTFTMPNLQCDKCGGQLRPVVKSNDEIMLVSMDDYYKLDSKFTNKVELSIIPKCKLPNDIKDKIVSEIEVPSGDLVLTNFFKKEELRGGHKFSINSLLGRVELTKHLAELNIGYGQMSNMSVDIFKRKDGKQIIIGDEEEFEYNTNEYDYLGSISLAVWRWMCADKSILEKYGEELPELKEDDQISDSDYRDYILAKVEKGTWVIEHFFDFKEFDNNGIYSILTKK